ncbi:MAG: hypothetical protein EBR30_23925 [Cytophagia bacterium]|jgi:hypothetical protein|nr:hypothetical protein [Cytophagia bacterium]
MKVMNDYECSQGHMSEHFVDLLVGAVDCPHCNEVAYKRLTAPRIKLEGYSGSFPTAADRWTKNHIEATKVAESKSYYEG